MASFLRHSIVPLALATLVTSCGSDLGTAPADTFDGVRYTAHVEEVLGTTQGSTARQVSVFVTLTNKTAETQTRTYPTSCGVLIRLYRQSDGSLLYDETRRSCPATPTATVTIGALGTATMQSGVRFPTIILGDSLPHTVYTVRAALLTEGSRFVIIDAGTVDLSK